MTKGKKLIFVPILLVFLMVFGAWTYQVDTEDRYADAALVTPRSSSETINYTDRVEKLLYNTSGNCPQYRQLSNMTNACGAIAGAEIVAFYDKYYPNMIAGWDSYYASGTYRMQDATYVPALMNELYTLMRTNVDDVGVSEDDFKNGLKSYVVNHGYSLSYTSVRNWLGRLNFDDCKAALDQNKVIVLFTKAGDVYQVTSSDGYDTITPTTIAGLHIMVAYGYYQVEYYNAKGLFRTDTYLHVAVGRNAPAHAYYRIDSTNLNAAYVVNVA